MFIDFLRKYRKLFLFINPDKTFLILLLLFKLISSASKLAMPFLLGKAVDTLRMPASQKSFLLLIVILFCLIVISQFFSFFQSHYRTKSLRETRLRAKVNLFRVALELPKAEFQKFRSGDWFSRFEEDATRIVSIIVDRPIDLVIQLGYLLSIFAVIFSLSRLLTAVFLLGLVVTGGLNVFLLRFNSSYYRSNYSISVGLFSFLQERLQNIPLIQLFTQKENETQKLAEKERGKMKYELNFLKWHTAYENIVTLFVFSTIAMLLLLGGDQVMKEKLTTGNLLTFLAYFYMVSEPLQAVSSAFRNLIEDSVSLERTWPFIERDKIKTKCLPIQRTYKRIRVRNISFGYEPDRTIISNVNIDFSEGTITGIIGKNGTGKTTLIEIICGYYFPEKGALYIGDQEIREIDLDSYRETIALVSQEIVLLNESIRDNLSYGSKNPSSPEIRRLAQLLGIHHKIVSMPDGYETVVGERALILSTGEKQKLAIIRALLRGSKLLIFDEATSHLDAATKRTFLEYLDTIKHDKIIIIISHDLSCLEKLDNILFLDGNGKFEIGTHERLLNEETHYRNLFVAMKQEPDVSTLEV